MEKEVIQQGSARAGWAKAPPIPLRTSVLADGRFHFLRKFIRHFSRHLVGKSISKHIYIEKQSGDHADTKTPQFLTAVGPRIEGQA
jgi:hypothetical protein